MVVANLFTGFFVISSFVILFNYPKESLKSVIQLLARLTIATELILQKSAGNLTNLLLSSCNKPNLR